MGTGSSTRRLAALAFGAVLAGAVSAGAALAVLTLTPQRAGAEPAVRGNPQAVPGGVRRTHFGVTPAQLHPLNATD